MVKGGHNDIGSSFDALGREGGNAWTWLKSSIIILIGTFRKCWLLSDALFHPDKPSLSSVGSLRGIANDLEAPAGLAGGADGAGSSR